MECVKLYKECLYKNGQKISELNGNILTYYYKNGKTKAYGKYIDEKMEGEWIFNRKNGELWQEGHLRENIKDGEWKRYNKNGELEYHVEFKDGKQIRKYK
jgi:antitoxin component YwqK of YwqJK toxin-antitoxin module